MPSDPTVPPPGWYPDPCRAGSRRWFDGSEWTGHAVVSDTPDPDALVERDWEGMTAEELRSQEQFSSNDLSIPHQDEARYDGGGGWQGLYTNRVGRGVMRAGTRWGPVRASRWLGGLTLVLAFSRGATRLTGCFWLPQPRHHWWPPSSSSPASRGSGPTGGRSVGAADRRVRSGVPGWFDRYRRPGVATDGGWRSVPVPITPQPGLDQPAHDRHQEGHQGQASQPTEHQRTLPRC